MLLLPTDRETPKQQKHGQQRSAIALLCFTIINHLVIPCPHPFEDIISSFE